jgi:hypothetical protein
MVLFLDSKETMSYEGRIHFLSTVIENGRFTLLHCTSTLSYPAMSGQGASKLVSGSEKLKEFHGGSQTRRHFSKLHMTDCTPEQRHEKEE